MIKTYKISSLKKSEDNKEDLLDLFQDIKAYTILQNIIQSYKYTSTYINEYNKYKELYTQYTDEIVKINKYYSKHFLNDNIRTKKNLTLLSQIKELYNSKSFDSKTLQKEISQYSININQYIEVIDKKLGKKLNINGKGLLNSKYFLLFIISIIIICYIIIIIDLFINFIPIPIEINIIIIFVVSFSLIMQYHD